MPKRRRRRGYPLAILVGLEGGNAYMWNIYSEAVRPGERIQGDIGYNFYEEVVDALRPSFKQGIKSILIAAPDERDYRRFMDHIRKHQSWLLGGWRLNTVTFNRIPERATDSEEVRALVTSRSFRERLTETTGRDTGQVMDVLERRLNDSKGIDTLLFTLSEVEDAVYGGGRTPEYILVTERFFAQRGRRTQRLLQVAANKNVKTSIIGAGTPAEARIAQLGGLVCMLRE
jgi:stalled ribosome rescue protein Dom34